MTGAYLVLGLIALGGLLYLLSQITLRQRSLHAELTRLERLAAEVVMGAEAVLDRVDERAQRLQHLLAAVEARAKAEGVAPAPAPDPAPDSAPERQAQPASAPTSLQRYQQIRAAVWALAEQGKGQAEIARALALPTGEIQLMLNLRGRKTGTI